MLVARHGRTTSSARDVPDAKQKGWRRDQSGLAYADGPPSRELHDLHALGNYNHMADEDR